MKEEEVFKKVLTTTIERFARQVMNYEIEIANLSAQIIALSEAAQEAAKPVAAKAAPVNEKK